MGKIRLHDLRQTFVSLLIQNGVSIAYVKEQMGHSSIQVTVDIYGHLIPGTNAFFRRYRRRRSQARGANKSATICNLRAVTEEKEAEIPSEVVDLIGGGGWTRTNDLRIMRCTFRGAATRIQSLTDG
jgi:integrase-like protein